MVDTINPNTNQPDSWGDSPAPAVPAATPEDRFYGGFDQPGETKINLAADQQLPVTSQPEETPQVTPAPAQSTPPVVESKPQPAPQAVSDVAVPVTPAETKHTTYTNTSDMINWRGVLVIAAIGITASIVVGLGLFFGLGAMNNSKIKDKEEQLTAIRSQLNTLQETPDPLELPVTETPTEEPVTEEPTPVVTPVTTPTETPVVIPSTTPTQNGDGSKTAAG